MLDEKFISGVLKLQKSVSFWGLRPLGPDQGFALDPTGRGGGGVNAKNASRSSGQEISA